MADYDSLPKSGDSELQEFLMVEKQKAQVNAQVCQEKGKSLAAPFHNLKCDVILSYKCVISMTGFQIHEFNEICWDKCIDSPSNKLDSKTETCLTNCVERFIDTSLLITNRFAQMLQKNSG